MAKWNDFEIECTNFLKDKYGKFATFELQGGSNSNLSDIKVQTTGNSFFIEAKQCPAQCGQFVLLPNEHTKVFDYSPLNFTALTLNTTMIIQHMNKNFDNYKAAGTKGKEIIFEGCKTVFANWVIDYYKSKNVRYFITNDYMILPIEKFSEYFDITAAYRVKKSGSRGLSKADLQPITDYIVKNYDTDSTRNDKTKLFVTSSADMHDTRFYLKQYEYMFSKRDKEYVIRKLSNTFNANVIFSITFEPTQNRDDLLIFETELR